MVLNEDTICTDKVQPKSRKQVSFDLAPMDSEGEELVQFPQGMEDYPETTTLDVDTSVATPTLASHGLGVVTSPPKNEAS